MLTICSILLPAILGFLLLTVILKNENDTHLGERIGLSFPLGTGILTLQIFLLGIMRVPLTLFNTATPLAIEIFLLGSLIFWKKIPLWPQISKPRSYLLSKFIFDREHSAKNILFAIFILWIFAKIVSVFFLAYLRPIYSWDAWAEWTTAAKVFFYSQSLLLDVPAEDFFGKSAVHRIIYYPLHNPLLQLWISLWNGTFDEILVKFSSPVYLLSLVVCFYYFAEREINKALALIMLIIFLSSPLMSYHAIELNGDLTLGVYIFLTGISFIKALRGNAAYWMITGIFATEALFIKEQAFLFILPLILSAIVYWKFDAKNNTRKSYLLKLLTPFLGIVPWYLFVHHYGLGFEAMQEYGHHLMTSIFGEDPNRFGKYLTFHPEILTGYLYWLVTLNNFNVILFFAPLLIITHGKPSKEFLHLLLPALCYMLSFLFIYMFTIFFSWFKWGVIFFRNTLTFYPAICLLIVLLLKKYKTSKPPLSD